MSGQFAFYDFEPETRDMREEVLAGLMSTPKQVSPKYFYDATGSELFEKITELPEYYPTRTEMALFDAHLPEVERLLGDNLALIEYGSGSSKKIRKLLSHIKPVAYVPVDISQEHLLENARALHADFPELNVYPVCADLTQPFDLPRETDDLMHVGFFPGSSIGNFEPEQARAFLALVRDNLGPQGAMVIGVDRKKDSAILERAYNDSQGVTAEFNLNLLNHLNARLNADFDLSAFSHHAIYNQAAGCIQMFLRSERDQRVTVAGQEIAFAAGELLHTENSYKYDDQEFTDLATAAGFKVERDWRDDAGYFSLFLLR